MVNRRNNDAYDEEEDKEDFISERKSLSHRSDTHRYEDFFVLGGLIDDKSCKSLIGVLAKEIGLAKSTIYKVMHENLDVVYHEIEKTKAR